MTKTTTAMVRLPHTGLRVPDTSLSITRLKSMPTQDGAAFTANLRVANKIVGTIEDQGNGGGAWFFPNDRRAYGDKELEAYAANCRTESGEEVNVEFLLAVLADEHEWASKVRRAEGAGRLLLRQMEHMTADGERPEGAAFAYGETSSAMPSSTKRWEVLRSELLAKMPPSRHGWWQGWRGGKWQDVTPRPEGVNEELYG